MRDLRGDLVDRDSDALLFRDLYPRLLAYARVLSVGTLDEEGLVQEAIVRRLERGSLSDLRSPEAYLRKSIFRIVVDRGRRARRFRERVSNLTKQAEEVYDDYPSDLEPLRALSPTDRAVVYLRSVERLDYSEIADHINTSPGAARVRHKRAIEKLRLSEGIAASAQKKAPTP